MDILEKEVLKLIREFYGKQVKRNVSLFKVADRKKYNFIALSNEIETKFKIEFSSAEWNNFKTVGDVLHRAVMKAKQAREQEAELQECTV